MNDLFNTQIIGLLLVKSMLYEQPAYPSANFLVDP